ncbi:neuromedin-S isoform 5-T5 [Liasis olivaceus]
MKMKQLPPPFPLLFVICCCAGQFTSGVPQTFASFLDESKVPKSERLALCFSQWTELFDQPQENNQELNKRFLFHYSRAQDPTYPLKTGELQIIAAKFTKKEGLDGLGRPFFLFRPRNGRTVDAGGK